MKDDDTLVQFLRTYRLDPPPPCPGLEEQLMAKIKPSGHSLPWLKVLTGLGLIISLLGFSLGRRWQIAHSVDQEQLEAYLIQNWETTTARSEDLTIDLFNYQEN